MKCMEVIKRLEELSPVSYAEPWDNIGLLAGRQEKQVKSILIALDATWEVVEEAARLEADMIITHHPMIFGSINRVNSDTILGRKLLELIKNDICYYAMHTNFDVMGMADAVADRIGLQARQALEAVCGERTDKEGTCKDGTGKDSACKENVSKDGIDRSSTDKDIIDRENAEESSMQTGMGRIGRLPRVMTLEECALCIKESFDLESVRVFGKRDKEIERAAIMPGSGKDFIQKAMEAGADVYITGDMNHHAGLDAVEEGLCVIDAGHFGLEQVFIPYMEEYITRNIKGLTVYTAKQKNPFWTI